MSEIYGPPLPVTGITLLLYLYYIFNAKCKCNSYRDDNACLPASLFAPIFKSEIDLGDFPTSAIGSA
jgi:hypothetical protein